MSLVVLLKKVSDEAVHKELGNRMERAATTASSLEAEQESENPTFYTLIIQQFWETASTSTSENEEMEITATIDRRVNTITEASIRRHLKLEDADGINSLPNTKFFKQLALMGPKKTAWEQFSSNIATAIICLATNRNFNFSKMIFEGMGRNSADTEILLEEPTKLVEDLVSTAAENLVYIRRSAEKIKDKGKAIMKEDEFVQKKIKKQLEQERLSHEEAIRLQEQINEEERIKALLGITEIAKTINKKRLTQQGQEQREL
ncbi:hypothetical protein Tco_0716935 [Tanacetum coccineum]